MGAYSPLSDLPDEAADAILERFHRPVLAELARRGTPFRGALYAGLILTADGPRLLEFNARFGDPETQAILPRLASPLGPILLAAARGALGGVRSLPTLPGATVGVVLAASGYPGTPATGDRIEGIDDAAGESAIVFHGASRRGSSGWDTAGGRVLTVVARGRDLGEAAATADRAAERIAWPGRQRRQDIGIGEAVAAAAGAAR